MFICKWIFVIKCKNRENKMKRLARSDDSEEDEIWNYKSVRNTKSRQVEVNDRSATEDTRLSVVRSRHSPAKDNRIPPREVKTCRKHRPSDRKRKTARAKHGDKDLSNGLSGTNFQPSGAGPASSQQFRSSCRTVGHCPSCQVPFSALTTVSPNTHVAQCLDGLCSASPRPECSFGADCASSIVCHYKDYSHSALALIRASLEVSGHKTEAEVQEQCEEYSTGIDPKRCKFGHNVKELNQFSECQSKSDVLKLSNRSELFPDSSTSAEKRFYDLDNRDELKLKELTQQNAFTDKSEMPDDRSISGSGTKCLPTQDDINAFSPNHLVSVDVNRKDEISALEAFRDISEMLDDAFSDEELAAVEIGADRPALPSDYCRRNVPELLDANCLKATGSGIIGSKISPVLNQTKRDDKRVSSGRSPAKPIPKSKRDNLKGQNKNLQQLSISNFFKSVNTAGACGMPVTQNKLPTSVGDKDVKLPQKGLSDNACAVENRVSKSLACAQASRIVVDKAKHPGLNSFGGIQDTAWNLQKGVKEVDQMMGLAIELPGQYARKCPFYKTIPNTQFCVDAFGYGTIPGCTAYFLSHFHSDHYMGLRKNFAHNIYCSKVTANLVLLKIRVSPAFVHDLPLNMPQVVDGVEVTLLDANHCPGSVMFLFKLRNGQVFLHTGDFRADPSMEEWPDLQSICISRLFLDTTYCDPTYDFPAQRDVVKFTVDKTLDFVSRHSNVLVVVGTYSIGKERIFLAIAEALNCKIFVTSDKKLLLGCLEDERLNERMTSKAVEARLHVLRMNQLNLSDLSEYIEKLWPSFEHLLAFEPTGWTHTRKALSLDNLRPKTSSRRVTVYAVPYSEHSSYTEMKRFVQFLRPDKIIPTVNNGNPSSRRKMEELFRAWMTASADHPNRTRTQQLPLNQWLETV